MPNVDDVLVIYVIFIKAIQSDYLSAESYSFLNNTYTDQGFIKIIAQPSWSL